MCLYKLETFRSQMITCKYRQFVTFSAKKGPVSFYNPLKQIDLRGGQPVLDISLKCLLYFVN